MKTKKSRETVGAFLIMITNRNRPKKNWVGNGTDFTGEFRMYCSAKGIQNFSILSETRAAFAERTIRSLKIVLYRYVGDHGVKYLHKMSQFVTNLVFRNNVFDRNDAKECVKNLNFFRSVQQATTRIWKKTKVYDWRHSSHCEVWLNLSGKDISQLYARSFLYCCRKPLTFTIKDEQDEIICDKLHQNELIKVIRRWIRLKYSWFLMHMHSFFRTEH